MADPEHLKILKDGVEAWNAWRKENPKVKPNFYRAKLVDSNLIGVNLHDSNLSFAQLGRYFCPEPGVVELIGANLSDSNLIGANLNSAYLMGTDLRGADLYRANLRGADLYRANLRRANLMEANLSEATLLKADLTDVNLSYADLSRADLTSADLRGVTVLAATLVGLDLRGPYGLKEIGHLGFCEVSGSTLARSRGKIPDIFLKGCGLSDWEIAAARLHDPDLTSEQITDLAYKIVRIKAESPVQVNPLFISYSHENADFVNMLEPQLDKKRIRYWRDIHHATSGPLEDIVDRAMRVNSIVLLILSEHSVESDWVQWEVKKARKLAKERKAHVLCPIALDKSWETCRWPERLRDQIEEYNILDFSKWEDEDAMGAAFQKLSDGLGIYYPKDLAG